MKIYFTSILIIVLVSIHFRAECQEVAQIDLTINDVVAGTEIGYVATSKGDFLLPGGATEVAFDYNTYSILVEKLENCIGKTVSLYVYNDAIVGISTDTGETPFLPEFKKRTKKIYSSPPLKLSTKMKYWDDGTYGLSITTDDGIFCVGKNFELRDYWQKIYNTLQERYKIRETCNNKIIIYYHKIDSYECQGDIEDIEFPMAE